MPQLPIVGFNYGAAPGWADDLNAAIESLAQSGDHASRPTTEIVVGALYSCTTHGRVYRWDGAAWSVWARLASPRTINPQTGTAYTLVLDDEGKIVTLTNAAAITLTVPPNSAVALPVGAVVEGAQLGAGQVTITPGTGVTINATPGLKVAEQYGTFALVQTAVDVWLAVGRLAA